MSSFQNFIEPYVLLTPSFCAIDAIMTIALSARPTIASITHWCIFIRSFAVFGWTVFTELHLVRKMFGSENNIDILLGARGAGVPEYGSRGVEQHGVPRKTWGSLYFAQLWIFLIFIKSRNISWERKPFKCQLAMRWFSFAWGVYFIFRSDLAWILFDLKKIVK